MSATSLSVSMQDRRLQANVGVVSLYSATAYLGAAKIVTLVNPFAAAIFMGSAIVITKIADQLLRNSANKSNVLMGILLGSSLIVAHYLGVKILHAALVTVISIIATECLYHLHRMIS